jgi:Zn-dependent protease
MIKLFRLWDIQFQIHWSFFLIFALIGFDEDSNFWFDSLCMASLFVCIVLHEIGHALAAKYYNIHTRSITIMIVGGVAALEEEPRSAKEEFWITFFGPLVNFVIFGILLLVNSYLRDVPEVWSNEFIENDILAWLMVINLVVAVFNLIPAWPLDGGRILRATLGFFMPFRRANYVASYVAQVLCAIIIGISIVPPVNWNMLLIFGVVFLVAWYERYNKEEEFEEKERLAALENNPNHIKIDVFLREMEALRGEPLKYNREEIADHND